MIPYLHATALVKRYVREAGWREVIRLFEPAATLGTSLVTRAEVAAAIARASRLRILARTEAGAAFEAFHAHWPSFVRLRVDEATVSDADALAWQHDLRGIDSIHLATALTWQSALGEAVVMATFDNQLRAGALAAGLGVWPEG